MAMVAICSVRPTTVVIDVVACVVVVVVVVVYALPSYLSYVIRMPIYVVCTVNDDGVVAEQLEAE